VEPIDITFDTETNNLLSEKSIDYTASPFQLKDSFNLHCIVVEEHQTGNIVAFYNGDTYILDGREYQESVNGNSYSLKDYLPVEYEHKQLDDFPEYVQSNKIRKVIGHNIINFDLLVLKLWFGMQYEVEPDMWSGKRVQFEDTLVIAKTLNPDRFGGASLDNLAKLANKEQKIEFRKHLHPDVRFRDFAADMLYYNIYDVKSNTAVYKYLEWEKGDWDWKPAIRLEKAVVDVITRQEHRGFWFDKDLAIANVAELDKLMEERRQRVEPLLPPRPATKKFLSEHTPPVNQVSVKEVYPPKKQFKGNREPSATLLTFAEKEGLLLAEEGGGWVAKKDGVIYKLPLDTDKAFRVEKSITTHMQNFVTKHNGQIKADLSKVKLYGKVYDLPMENKPIKEDMVATVDDSSHIKNWLVGLGWQPTEYKEKDITVKSGPSKAKRTPEELEKAIDKYVEETLASNLKRDRMLHFEINNLNPITFRRKIMQQAEKRGCKVLTNPSFTVGQEKEIDPALLEISDTFPYVKDVVEYLTYKHRRNSILGGGFEWDEDGDEEPEKGYLANLREDGRIATPADTCGAATSRMKHKVVANIPRVSSLYGGKMRALFGVDAKNYLQVGYDFSSLEAMIEAHYCYAFEKEVGRPYCTSLLQEKPNDVHSKTAIKISETLGKPFERSSAKSCKYGITYGSQPSKVAKIIGGTLEDGKQVYDAFWEAAPPLKKLKDALTEEWKSNGNKKFIVSIDNRKVPTRAEHAILNSLFQSAGVICAKHAMVVHDRLLKKEGLSVDFFEDDWKHRKFCQQLIAYHDECQLEESKSNFKFKKFESSEQALAWTKEQDEVWSEPFKAKDGWFVGYSRASELVSVAVNKTSEHFKLNVQLQARYILGRNWMECH